MEKVSDMLVYLTNKHIKDPVKDAEIDKVDVKEILQEQSEAQKKDMDVKEEKAVKMKRIRAKIMVAARMNRILKTIKNNQEEILAIKALAPDGKVPMGILTGGSAAVHNEWQKFHSARISDYKNEGFPKNSRRLS